MATVIDSCSQLQFYQHHHFSISKAFAHLLGNFFETSWKPQILMRAADKNSTN